MVDNTQLINRLAEFLPAESIIHEQEALRPYECDGLPAYRQLPLLAVLPDTTEQVQQVMRVCHEMQVPVVARGAATGLSGGALPLGDGILLGLSKFNRMIEINRQAHTARVQPGVRNLAISEAAKKYGLYYAPDPSS